ncbi:hypothetical protein UFOVP51_35 [uncultured Caudovirales phage]|uniref:Uncharacterized protein n=1 Tax=uncultured Caudovirales phage TaxID=2100421 RepID=A0A6J5KSV7_9CAUD|nr:hypothetical protein UFOVP51_35 [uncultured Caudovirales phage]CAB4241072.1 hypothetical protein UFOVP34_71 [uncultured Caudovirales phage]
MLKTLNDIIEYEKNINQIRSLLEQIHKDLCIDKLGDDAKLHDSDEEGFISYHNNALIDKDALNAIYSIKLSLNKLEFVGKKRCLIMSQKAISDISDILDKNNEKK